MLRRHRNTASASEKRVQGNNLSSEERQTFEASSAALPSCFGRRRAERSSGDVTLELLLSTPYCPTPGRPGGIGRTRQPSEPCRWTGAAASEGKEGRGLPDDAFRDPYGPLPRANAADDCDWLKRRPSRVAIPKLRPVLKTLPEHESWQLTETDHVSLQLYVRLPPSDSPCRDVTVTTVTRHTGPCALPSRAGVCGGRSSRPLTPPSSPEMPPPPSLLAISLGAHGHLCSEKFSRLFFLWNASPLFFCFLSCKMLPRGFSTPFMSETPK